MTFLTKDDFDKNIEQGVVLVDFFADWCGPCHMLSPVIEQIAKNYEGKIQAYKLDVDATPEIAQRFSVMSIPTVIFFKDGKEVDKIVGAQPESRYTDIIDTLNK